MSKKTDLIDIIKEKNLISRFKEDELRKLAEDLVKTYEDDLSSMGEFIKESEEILKLVHLTVEPKNWPWEGAANIKYPLIAQAMLLASSRLFQETIKNDKVVFGESLGYDFTGEVTDQAERVSRYMSYQMLIESPDWEKEKKKTISAFLALGTAHTETYFDTLKGREVTRLCPYNEFIINKEIPSLEDAKQITTYLNITTNSFESYIRAGIFDGEHAEEIKKSLQPKQQYLKFLVIYCYYDFDDDGYEEPYVVYIHEKTKKIVGMQARFDPQDIYIIYDDNGKNEKIVSIKPNNRFTSYHCFERADGTYFSSGLGSILLHLNKAINSLNNQLINAGALELDPKRIMTDKVDVIGGTTTWTTGEIKIAKLKDPANMVLKEHVFEFEHSPPSDVLFKMLEFLVNAGKELVQYTDTNNGTAPAQNITVSQGTEIAQNGAQIFASIQRSYYKSLQQEYDIWFKLNSVYLNPVEYFTVMQNKLAVKQTDFNPKMITVRPVADPVFSTKSEMMHHSNLLFQLMNNPALSGALNIDKVLLAILKTAEIPNPEQLIKPAAPPPPDPKLLQVQAKMQQDEKDNQLKVYEQQRKDKELSLKQQQMYLDSAQIKSETMKSMAEAQEKQSGTQIDAYRAQTEAAHKAHDQKIREAEVQIKAFQAQTEAQHKMSADIIQAHQAHTDEKATVLDSIHRMREADIKDKEADIKKKQANKPTVKTE